MTLGIVCMLFSVGPGTGAIELGGRPQVFPSTVAFPSTAIAPSLGSCMTSKFLGFDRHHMITGSLVDGAVYERTVKGTSASCASKPPSFNASGHRLVIPFPEVKIAWNFLERHPMIAKFLVGGASFLFLATAWPFHVSSSMFLPFSSRIRSPAVRNVLAVVLMLSKVDPGVAVCPHCSDTIAGCDGTGGNCPLSTELVANTRIFQDLTLGTVPKVTNLMTPELSHAFSRQVCEAIVGIACAPAVGTAVDLSDAAYATSQSVVQAAAYGHCSVAEATSELATRLEAATDALTAQKIKGAMDGLKIVTDTAITTTQGVFMFIFSKCSNVVMNAMDGVTRLTTVGATGANKGGAALTVKLTRPTQWTEFMEMLHQFLMAVLSLGLCHPAVICKFYDDVVWGAIRAKESWETAFELMLLYLEEVDRDPKRTVKLATVFRRGGQDTLLAEARRRALAFFRVRAGNAQPSGTSGTSSAATAVKPNGQFNKNTDKPCVDFNMGRPCKRLDSSGKCLFNHVCNQFVSDKGPAGVCGGAHARHAGCSYDAAKKLNKPATA